MATVGHVAVGLAAARAFNDGRQPRWPVAAAWSALALLPDADVIGFPLGIHYEARGAIVARRTRWPLRSPPDSSSASRRAGSNDRSRGRPHLPA
jgi:hypothetical protein